MLSKQFDSKLLFRLWDDKLKIMFPHEYLLGIGHELLIAAIREHNVSHSRPWQLMFGTHMEDHEEQMLYTYDIFVLLEDGKPSGNKYFAKYCEIKCAYMAYPMKAFKDALAQHAFDLSEIEPFKIIGNCYQHPELLS